MVAKTRRPIPPHPNAVPPEKLRLVCDPELFEFETTAELGDCPIQIIGQSRAMSALRLGVAIRDHGYNIFAAGEVGSGRSTAVRRVLSEIERGGGAPDDLCYVHDFQDPDQPKLLAFPAGKGRAFQKAMERLVDGLRKNMPELLDSELSRRRRSARMESAQEKQKGLLKAFEAEVEREGFALVQVQLGPFVRPSLLPVVAGNPVDMDQLESLVEEGKFQRREYERLKSKKTTLTSGLATLTKSLQAVERGLREEIAGLDRELARPLVEESLGEIRDDFSGDAVHAHLDRVGADILDHLDRFRDPETPPTSGAERDQARKELRERMLCYAVNLVVDNSATRGRPIHWETSPNYRNLFGTIEHSRDVGGEWQADHTRIKSGSLLKANGGFLVVDAMDVLVEPGVWAALKRTLRNRVLEIQAYDPLSLMAGGSLKPEKAPIDVKVILIGTRQIHRILHAIDEDFQKIFKVKAEFTVETPLSDEELNNYACFVHKKCQDDHLPPFHRTAVAAVVEHGVRLAGRRDKLTTRFNEVADVVREAGYWARQDKVKRVEAKHVEQALVDRIRRVNLAEEMLRERIAEGTVLIDLQGEKVGQVNGLVVLDVGDHVFGLPTRITAVTAMGRAGIVDIEREALMSGAIHTKGVLILAGFLRARFAQDKPLTLSASLCFEQNYDEIDGDSASSAELYALLSSLSGVPLRQGIAVTGSVNQKGDVQPIGGLNEKIEGFYDLCVQRGLDGSQGVMMPTLNVPHLMLRKDVVASVAEGRFRLWAVATIEEGIAVLTGMAAGDRGKGGAYPPDSVFGRVDARLSDLATAVREFGLADGSPG
jgi:lon-related putative ATP-dependent protease